MHNLTSVTIEGFLLFMNWCNVCIQGSFKDSFMNWCNVTTSSGHFDWDNVALKRFLFSINYGKMYLQGFDSFMDWCNIRIHLNLLCKNSITSDAFKGLLLFMNCWNMSFHGLFLCKAGTTSGALERFNAFMNWWNVPTSSGHFD